ncbi:MAG TPA: hypothetical protein VGB71_01820 [Flavisolibacter sp.]
MKYNFAIIVLINCLFLSSGLQAQNSCRQEAVYRTSSVGNGKESFPLALMFFIKSDTLRIANNERSAKASDNVPFLITEKICSWNADYSEGKSFFKLLLTEKGEVKRPTLAIEINEKKGKIILQYENAEPRVFEMIL